MSKWIAEFELEDGDTMPEHMDLEYKGANIGFHCRPMWIPCSERLPEKHQMVITTIIGTDVIRMSPGETFEDALARVRNHVRVSVGYLGDDGWYGADGFPQIVKPIAWMPMPEPYREVVDD